MAFKKYDSSYKRTESPFTIQGLDRFDEMDRNRRAKESDEKNKEKLLERSKGRMIKKAERKEKKAKKRTEQGRERSATRKTRKATRIRKRAGELTADEVVAQRDRMRRRASSEMRSPYRKETNQPVNPNAKPVSKPTRKTKHATRPIGPNEKRVQEFRSPALEYVSGGAAKLLVGGAKLAYKGLKAAKKVVTAKKVRDKIKNKKK
jgi:hypothetical protein